MVKGMIELDKYRTDPAKYKTVKEYLAALDEEYASVVKMFADAERSEEKVHAKRRRYAPEFYLQEMGVKGKSGFFACMGHKGIPGQQGGSQKGGKSFASASPIATLLKSGGFEAEKLHQRPITQKGPSALKGGGYGITKMRTVEIPGYRCKFQRDDGSILVSFTGYMNTSVVDRAEQHIQGAGYETKRYTPSEFVVVNPDTTVGLMRRRRK